MLKVVLSAVGFVTLGVWSTCVLWQTSPCKRAEVAAVPVYYAAQATMFVVEPFRGYSEEESQNSSNAAKMWMQNQIAKWIYSRKGGHEHLCWSDPIFVLEKNGWIDHRGLIKSNLDGKKLYVKTDKPETTPNATAMQDSPNQLQEKNQENPNKEHEEKTNSRNFLVIIATILLMLLIGYVTLKWMAADKKAKEFLNVITGPLKDAKTFSKNTLPREAIIPEAGKEATDQSK